MHDIIHGPDSAKPVPPRRVSVEAGLALTRVKAAISGSFRAADCQTVTGWGLRGKAVRPAVLVRRILNPACNRAQCPLI